MDRHMNQKSRTVLITGVSSGIGYGATMELIHRNYTIFGSVRKKDDAQRLQKEFGEKLSYSKLTTGCFPSDEYEAWEFTAIAANLTHGIGVYRRVNGDGLQIFLVVTKFVDNETAQNIKDKFVQCSTHEYRRRAFVSISTKQQRLALKRDLKHSRAWSYQKKKTFKHGVTTVKL